MDWAPSTAPLLPILAVCPRGHHAVRAGAGPGARGEGLDGGGGDEGPMVPYDNQRCMDVLGSVLGTQGSPPDRLPMLQERQSKLEKSCLNAILHRLVHAPAKR